MFFVTVLADRTHFAISSMWSKKSRWRVNSDVQNKIAMMVVLNCVFLLQTCDVWAWLMNLWYDSFASHTAVDHEAETIQDIWHSIILTHTEIRVTVCADRNRWKSRSKMAGRIEVCTKRLTTWQIYYNGNRICKTVQPNGLKNADTSHISVIVRQCRRCRRDKFCSYRWSICQSSRFHLPLASAAYFQIHLAKEHGHDGWGWNGNSMEWCAKENHPCVTHPACLCYWCCR